MNEKTPRQRWREREPEGWTWAPRPGVWWAWLRRRGGDALAHGVGALRFAARALLNIDRWNWSAAREASTARWTRIWERLLSVPENYLRLLGRAGLVLLPLWIILIGWIGYVIVLLLLDFAEYTPGSSWRDKAYAFGALLAALAALIAAPLVLIRAWVAERHTRTAEEGLITDRFTRAVEQLGVEKTVKRREFKPQYKVKQKDERSSTEDRWERDAEGNPIPATRPDGTPLGEWETFEETVPNLEVRLGAIYALERIAQDSERDHIPIMETLCAYVRENAPASGASDHGLGDWKPLPDDASEEQRAAHLERRKERFGRYYFESKAWIWAQGLDSPRADIRAALTVIGRRPAERIAHERRQRNDGSGDGTGGATGFRLDLRGANLQRADLTGLDLTRALLTGTRLEGADLWQARLDGADLAESRLEGADLAKARLEGADLGEARLEGAGLRGAWLEGAHLWRARLKRAHLAGARLEGANLRGARLKGAHLGPGGNGRMAFSGARLEGADLRGARLEGANLLDARLEGADLRGTSLRSAHLEGWSCGRANLRSADFTSAEHLTQEHVNVAWGDSGTKRPDGIVMPDHWDDETIEPFAPDPKYQAWLAAGAPAGKPRADRA